MVKDEGGQKVNLNALWERRQSCKFNGASYISQRGALAVYSEQGRAQTRATIDYYLETARIIRESMQEIGLNPQGGENAPYIWAQTPGGMDSWEFFACLRMSQHCRHQRSQRQHRPNHGNPSQPPSRLPRHFRRRLTHLPHAHPWRRRCYLCHRQCTAQRDVRHGIF